MGLTTVSHPPSRSRLIYLSRPEGGIGGRTEELESGRSGGNAAVVDDDDDDMDPRTLEQAAARLAHLTAEDLEGVETSRPQWADLYKESGPDGLGALGDEPALDLVAWRLGSSGSEGACEGAAGGGDSARGPVDPVRVGEGGSCR